MSRRRRPRPGDTPLFAVHDAGGRDNPYGPESVDRQDAVSGEKPLAKMQSTLVDELARRRATTDGLGETLFIEAGAGSGKTTTIVERVVNLVAREGVPLANIAAITFTEAAATELRNRVRQTLDRRRVTDAQEIAGPLPGGARPT